MKRFSEQLHTQSQTVKLTKSEQADLRERVVSYMEYHPLPVSMRAADVLASKQAAQFGLLTNLLAWNAVPYRMLFKFGGVAAVFVLIIIPFMAEQTVPGDTLYAVKVQFNEEVRSTLTWGSYEKVEWETTRLNRRIAEARLLADEGLLTQEVESDVAAAVKHHSDNAKREIAVLRATDADEATMAMITLDSSLQVQAKALQGTDANVIERNGETAGAGNLISDVIGASLVNITDGEVPAVPAYARLMARVELNTTRLYELRDTLAGSIPNQALSDVNRRIEDIERAIKDAIVLVQAPDTELAAREALVDVLARTQKLVVFMTDLEVREQVAIESVVPVVLTNEEMEASRTERMARLSQFGLQINAALEQALPADVVEELQVTTEVLRLAQETLTAITDYRAFVVASDEVLVQAADSLQLVKQQDLNSNTDMSSTSASTSTQAVPDTATSSPAVTAATTSVESTQSTSTQS